MDESGLQYHQSSWKLWKIIFLGISSIQKSYLFETFSINIVEVRNDRFRFISNEITRVNRHGQTWRSCSVMGWTWRFLLAMTWSCLFHDIPSWDEMHFFKILSWFLQDPGRLCINLTEFCKILQKFIQSWKFLADYTFLARFPQDFCKK